MARVFTFSTAQHLDTTNFAVAPSFAAVAFWLKLNGHGTSEQTFFGNYNGGGGQLIRLSDLHPGQLGAFWISTPAAGNEAIGATVLSVGTWYHVCVTFDGRTTIIYLNGVQDGTATAATGLAAGGLAWRLGLRLAGTVPADATMGEVGVWISGLLSATQVKALAGGTSPFDTCKGGSINSLSHYWPLFGSFDNGINYARGLGNQGTSSLITTGTVATANPPPSSFPAGCFPMAA